MRSRRQVWVCPCLRSWRPCSPLLAAGCGGGDEATDAAPPAEPAEPAPAEPPAEPPAETGAAPAETTEALSGSIEVDGSSTVGPLIQAAAEFFQEENPDVNVTVGVSGTGGGFERFCVGETDISNASRPIDEEEPTEAPACADERHRVRRAPGGDRRAHGGRQPGERLGHVPDGRAAQHDVGARGRGHGHELEPGRPELPRPGARARRRRHGLRDVRLLHRRHQRRGRREPRRLQRHRGRQRHRRAVAGEPGALGYFGFSYYEQNQDTPEGRRDRRRLGLRGPEPGDRPGRLLHAALAAALHLREDGVARAARGRRVRPVHPRQQRRRSPRPRCSSRSNDEQLATEQEELDCRSSARSQEIVATTGHHRSGRPAGSPAGRPQAPLRRGRDQVVAASPAPSSRSRRRSASSSRCSSRRSSSSARSTSSTSSRAPAGRRSSSRPTSASSPSSPGRSR